MFNIDKESFGAFVASLRRERGLTQRDLAGKLYVSDKAVSKWETGRSFPDISLLTPLAEELGVTVTELLNCRRMEEGEKLAPEETDELLRRALEMGKEPRRPSKRNVIIFLSAAAVSGLELILLLAVLHWRPGEYSAFLWAAELMGGIFGAYAFLLMRTRLPAYYDENRIDYYTEGFLRIHISGVSFNNRNWPHILKAIRTWAAADLVLGPILVFAMERLLPQGGAATTVAGLALLLGGLFIPVYAAAGRVR